jgi:hypothetical protein
MRKGKSETSSLAERKRECAKGKLKANGQQMDITNRRRWVAHRGFLCDVRRFLSEERG